MKTKLLGCLAATAMAAIVVATPALAQHGGGMSGGGMHFGGGMPGGRMLTGRSVFVPGGNRFVGAPFAATAIIRYNQSQINLLAALGLIDQTNREGAPTAAPALDRPIEPTGSAPN